MLRFEATIETFLSFTFTMIIKKYQISSQGMLICKSNKNIHFLLTFFFFLLLLLLCICLFCILLYILIQQSFQKTIYYHANKINCHVLSSLHVIECTHKHTHTHSKINVCNALTYLQLQQQQKCVK